MDTLQFAADEGDHSERVTVEGLRAMLIQLLMGLGRELQQRHDFVRTLLVGLSLTEDSEILRCRSGLTAQVEHLHEAMLPIQDHVARLFEGGKDEDSLAELSQEIRPLWERIVEAFEGITEWVRSLELLEIREFGASQYGEMIEELITETRRLHSAWRTLDDILHRRHVDRELLSLRDVLDEALLELGESAHLRFFVAPFEEIQVLTNLFMLRTVLLFALQDSEERAREHEHPGSVKASLTVQATEDEVILRIASPGRIPEAQLLADPATGKRPYFAFGQGSAPARRWVIRAFSEALGFRLNVENRDDEMILILRIPRIEVHKIHRLKQAGLVDDRIGEQLLAHYLTRFKAYVNHVLSEPRRRILLFYNPSSDGVCSALLFEKLLMAYSGGRLDPDRIQTIAIQHLEPVEDSVRRASETAFSVALDLDFETLVERAQVELGVLLDHHDLGAKIREIRPGELDEPERQRILYISPRKRLLVETPFPTALLVKTLAICLLGDREARRFEDELGWLAALAIHGNRSAELWQRYLARFDADRLREFARIMNCVAGCGNRGAELCLGSLRELLNRPKEAPLIREYFAIYSPVFDTIIRSELRRFFARDELLRDRLDGLARTVVDFVYEKMPGMKKETIDCSISPEDRVIEGQTYSLAGQLAETIQDMAWKQARSRGEEPPALVVVAEVGDEELLRIEARSDPRRVDCALLMARLAHGGGEPGVGRGTMKIAEGDPLRSFGDFMWEVQAYFDSLKMNRAVAIDHYVAHSLGMDKGDGVILVYDETQKDMAAIFADILTGKKIACQPCRLDTSHGRDGLEDEQIAVLATVIDRVRRKIPGRLLVFTLFGPRQQTRNDRRMKYYEMLQGKQDRQGRQVMRAFALELSDEILLSRILQEDLPKTIKRGDWLLRQLEGARQIRIETPGGTNLTTEIDPEMIHVDMSPEYLRAGLLGSLPIGQLFALTRTDLPASTEGTVVVDVSFTGISWMLEKERHQVRFLVREGRVLWDTVECEVESFRDEFLRLLATDEQASCVSAVGIGLVAKLRLKPQTVWNEKALGVGTIELGGSTHFGGSIQSNIHICCAVKDPTYTITYMDDTVRRFRMQEDGIEELEPPTA